MRVTIFFYVFCAMVATTDRDRLDRRCLVEVLALALGKGLGFLVGVFGGAIGCFFGWWSFLGAGCRAGFGVYSRGVAPFTWGGIIGNFGRRSR
jgi:hypothetical protein